VPLQDWRRGRLSTAAYCRRVNAACVRVAATRPEQLQCSQQNALTTRFWRASCRHKIDVCPTINIKRRAASGFFHLASERAACDLGIRLLRDVDGDQFQQSRVSRSISRTSLVASDVTQARRVSEYERDRSSQADQTFADWRSGGRKPPRQFNCIEVFHLPVVPSMISAIISQAISGTSAGRSWRLLRWRTRSHARATERSRSAVARWAEACRRVDSGFPR
jgi:hypothetical protein